MAAPERVALLNSAGEPDATVGATAGTVSIGRSNYR
jgi:hypothetical protein